MCSTLDGSQGAFVDGCYYLGSECRNNLLRSTSPPKGEPEVKREEEKEEEEEQEEEEEREEKEYGFRGEEKGNER